MKDIIIRNAETADVEQIAEICVEDWRTAYRGILDDAYLDSMSVEEQVRKELPRYRNHVVAADGRVVLGYAWLQLTEEASADCEIVALYVRNSCRRKGIGRLLMQYAINHFRGLGRKRMILWCLKENHESRRFYEAMGGKEFMAGTHQWGEREYEIVSYVYDLKQI